MPYKTIAASKIEIAQLMLPSNTNFGGKIHGGYILELMDQIAFACASKHSGSYCVTASVDQVNFLMPIEVGELVTMKASVNYVGHSSMVVGIRVEAENIRTGLIKHCNSSYFTMVAVNDSGKTQEVPGLIIRNKKEAKRFIESLKRREYEQKKQADLKSINRDINSQIELLKSHRVQVAFQ